MHSFLIFAGEINIISSVDLSKNGVKKIQTYVNTLKLGINIQIVDCVNTCDNNLNQSRCGMLQSKLRRTSINLHTLFIAVWCGLIQIYSLCPFYLTADQVNSLEYYIISTYTLSRCIFLPQNTHPDLDSD